MFLDPLVYGLSMDAFTASLSLCPLSVVLTLFCFMLSDNLFVSVRHFVTKCIFFALRIDMKHKFTGWVVEAVLHLAGVAWQCCFHLFAKLLDKHKITCL